MELVNTKTDITETQLLLTKLKILSIAWELNIEHKNKIVWKILKFISGNNIWDIFRLSGIKEYIKKELENIF